MREFWAQFDSQLKGDPLCRALCLSCLSEQKKHQKSRSFFLREGTLLDGKHSAHLLVEQFVVLSLELLQDVLVVEQFLYSAVRLAEQVLN